LHHIECDVNRITWISCAMQVDPRKSEYSAPAPETSAYTWWMGMFRLCEVVSRVTCLTLLAVATSPAVLLAPILVDLMVFRYLAAATRETNQVIGLCAIV
jgi:hypothetical protein